MVILPLSAQEHLKKVCPPGSFWSYSDCSPGLCPQIFKYGDQAPLETHGRAGLKGPRTQPQNKRHISREEKYKLYPTLSGRAKWLQWNPSCFSLLCSRSTLYLESP